MAKVTESIRAIKMLFLSSFKKKNDGKNRLTLVMRPRMF